MPITDFPASLQAALQVDMLNREFEEGLDSILAYRRMALQETIPGRVGETLTRTRKGRTPPNTVPLTGAQVQANLDNSMTPVSYGLEQYTFAINRYAGTQDVYLMQELAGIADQVIAASRNNGVAGAQSLERIAKTKLFAAYNGGNTYVRTGLGASTTTTCHVDDIRGFQTVLVNGVVTPISPTNPLSVVETATSVSGVNQTLTVTAATPDGVNASFYPGAGGVSDGISGTLTFNAATAPANGDALVASSSARVFRAGNKLTTLELTGSDVLTIGVILDAVAYLRNNGVPALSNGNYACILDNASLRALFSDQQFNVMFASANRSLEWRSGDVFDLLGVTFIPTTEAYVQLPNGTTSPQVTVRRPVIMGAETIIQGNFEGLEIWLAREGVSPIGDIMLVNNVAQIVRPPLDRLMEQLSMSWTWIGDFAVPTDVTATNTIIPTASSSLFKRAVVIEHAG